jgi:Na+-transporting NADH:ubiquinone oxidoreductase subunit C
MKKDGFYAERIKPVVVMAIITIICIFLVSILYLSTQERVTANEGLVLKKALLYAGGLSLPESNNEINALYDKQVKEKDSYYEITDSSGKTISYAFIQKGPGLWGEIEAITAFKPDFKEFAGIEFIKQNETPGLGARITEKWFKEQIRGKETPLTMEPEGTESSKPTVIDAITGASRTSEYVLSIFNQAGKRAAQLKGEVK